MKSIHSSSPCQLQTQNGVKLETKTCATTHMHSKAWARLNRARKSPGAYTWQHDNDPHQRIPCTRISRQQKLGNNSSKPWHRLISQGDVTTSDVSQADTAGKPCQSLGAARKEESRPDNQAKAQQRERTAHTTALKKVSDNHSNAKQAHHQQSPTPHPTPTTPVTHNTSTDRSN